ncbi:MAG: tryptophan 2,3-dioxygenase [Symploca sp. SIO1B1]|nr:tryptophan 2,3-dioxygenase [Symploca sp. SIO1B1]
MELTYANYLKLEKLLCLQEPKSSPYEHDEMLFIIMHQNSELWLKLVLYEVDKVKADFSSGNLHGAIATLQRIKAIMRLLVSQLDIIETMTPLSFAKFRNCLGAASGFQSYQFRQLEFSLGYKRAETLNCHKHEPAVYETLLKELKQYSLVDHFYNFLEYYSIAIPDKLRSKEISSSSEPNKTLQQEIFQLYHQHPELVLLFELMIDFDKELQQWRYRHIKVAERIIGNKGGTGGSLGVKFLKGSLFKAVFPDLWAIRDEF